MKTSVATFSAILLAVYASPAFASCGMYTEQIMRLDVESRLNLADIRAAGSQAEKCRLSRARNIIWETHNQLYKDFADCMARDGYDISLHEYQNNLRAARHDKQLSIDICSSAGL